MAPGAKIDGERPAGLTLAAVDRMQKACLTMAEVAQLLELDVRTVARGCADGQLPSIRVGRRTLVPREPLIALLRAGAA